MSFSPPDARSPRGEFGAPSSSDLGRENPVNNNPTFGPRPILGDQTGTSSEHVQAIKDLNLLENTLVLQGRVSAYVAGLRSRIESLEGRNKELQRQLESRGTAESNALKTLRGQLEDANRIIKEMSDMYNLA
ncbi:hypothetical protein TWF730_000117 [Orbilia blumenaviensis]|uniref:Uncharacterized protein n=1 Tax=Orbilia blumenaviensis TaxID=1796055 RepID=A0AAV9VMN0_9PEZI